MKTNKLVNDDDLDLLFEEIRSGERCSSIDGRLFFFRYPTSKDLEYCFRIEKLFKIQYENIIPNSRNITSFLTRNNITNDLDFWEREIIKNEKIIENDTIKTNAESLKFYNLKLREAKKNVELIKSLEIKKSSSEEYSFEYKLKQTIFTHLIRRCTFVNKNGELVNFFEGKMLRVFYRWFPKLVDEFLDFYYGPEESVIRRLCRTAKISNLWRISCRNNSPFFNGPVTEYTPVQSKVCFWLTYYSDVFQNLGTPDNDAIISNDDQFDSWVKGKIQELKSKSSDKSGNKGDHKHRISFSKPTRATSARASL